MREMELAERMTAEARAVLRSRVNGGAWAFAERWRVVLYGALARGPSRSGNPCLLP